MRRETQRAPPLVNAEAERVLLGKILADDKLYYEVADQLRPDDFGDEQHRAIFRAMQALAQKGTPIMRASIQSQLVSVERLDGVGIAAYMAAIVAEAALAEYHRQHIGQFARIVVHNSARRNLIEISGEIRNRAVAATLDTSVEELRSGVINLVSSVETNEPDYGLSFIDLMTSVVQSAGRISAAGIKTGFWPFDRLSGPLFPGQLIVIGGETSSGKTALALQIALSAGKAQIPVELFELEMTSPEVGARWASMISRVPVNKISEGLADGGVDELELDKIADAGLLVGDIPVEVDDRPAISVPTLQARLARSIRRRGTKLAVVDHLQYCRPNPGINRENEQIRQIVDDLKAVAKRLQIPIILVSHVHRKSERIPIETADDIRRPELTDLYGSSAIEKAADVVIFVHRPGYFLERATPRADKKGQHAADLLRWEGRAELVLCKNRQRKGFGVSECDFNEELTMFGDGDIL